MDLKEKWFEKQTPTLIQWKAVKGELDLQLPCPDQKASSKDAGGVSGK